MSVQISKSRRARSPTDRRLSARPESLDQPARPKPEDLTRRKVWKPRSTHPATLRRRLRERGNKLPSRRKVPLDNPPEPRTTCRKRGARVPRGVMLGSQGWGAVGTKREDAFGEQYYHRISASSRQGTAYERKTGPNPSICSVPEV